MLEPDEIREHVTNMWQWHQQELPRFQRIHDYLHGRLGYPQLPEEADNEVRELARLSIKNVLRVVRDSFTQNLSVVGYKTAGSRENLPAWQMWQRNRMDARQSEINRPCVAYGVTYVTVTPGDDGPVFRPRSPRQLIAVYEDPQVDEWPQYALETWVDTSNTEPRRKAMLYDDEYLYPLDLGRIDQSAIREGVIQRLTIASEGIGEPIRHGAEVCPVVRYICLRDAEDLIVGEIEPLIDLQRTINSVNFDRLIVSRFGAFPQKVISGWTGSKSEVLAASAKRVWTFDDVEVKAQVFPAASVEPYNGLLNELMEHVAMEAQISPARVTGKMVNISAEALAAAEADQQRKLAAMRLSLGESHEQLIRLGARMAGDQDTADDLNAEVVWRDTEARSFGAVVDGVTKLAQAGVPIESLLTMIPGMTQQQILGVQEAMRSQGVARLIDALRPAAQEAVADPVVDELASRTDAVTA